MAVVECGVQAVEESAGRQCHGVAEEAEVEVGLRVELHLSGIFANEECLEGGVVVQGVALCFDELAAHAEVVLVVGVGSAEGVGECEVAQVARHKSFQPCLCPFVEPFEQRDGECVLQVVMAGFVVDGIACEAPYIIIGMRVIVRWRLIGLVDALVVVELHGVDEAGDGHVFVFEPRGVFLGFLLGCQQAVGGSLALHEDALGDLCGVCSERVCHWF